MLYMNYPLCGNCAFSGGFVRECTNVSLSDVAGEGVELTVHKESVVVEEIKEVELRSRGAHVRVFVWKGIRKNIFSYCSSAFTINSQPRRRSLSSHGVFFDLNTDKSFDASRVFAQRRMLV